MGVAARPLTLDRSDIFHHIAAETPKTARKFDPFRTTHVMFAFLFQPFMSPTGEKFRSFSPRIETPAVDEKLLHAPDSQFQHKETK